MRSKLIGLVAILFTVSSVSVSAIVIDLGNQGHMDGSGDLRTWHYSNDGLDVRARGSENGFSDREGVTRTSNGLGVNSDGDNTQQLDGTDGTEWLAFSVNQGGVLNLVDLSLFGSNDDWNLVVDGRRIFSDSSADPWRGAIAFNSWFAIGADGSSDEFRVRRIGFSVPEPSTIGLIALGLLGLGLSRRANRS